MPLTVTHVLQGPASSHPSELAGLADQERVCHRQECAIEFKATGRNLYCSLDKLICQSSNDLLRFAGLLRKPNDRRVDIGIHLGPEKRQQLVTQPVASVATVAVRGVDAKLLAELGEIVFDVGPPDA